MIRAFVCALAVSFLIACAPAEDSSDKTADTLALIAIANGLDIAVDAKDWEKARSFFTDEIRLDFAADGGGEPSVVPADMLIERWRENLFAEKVSFHVRGNHVVEIDGDQARVITHGYAWNRLDELADEGGALWEVWGAYEYDFARVNGVWKITSFAFDAVHERGNPAVRTALPNQ